MLKARRFPYREVEIIDRTFILYIMNLILHTAAHVSQRNAYVP